MSTIVTLLLILPLIGFGINLLLPTHHERFISRIALWVTGVNLIISLGFVSYWIASGYPTLHEKGVTLYQTDNFIFFLDFFVDRISTTYLLVGASITFLIVLFSRSYMHRESGYKRFFSTLLFFYFGYLWTVFSGNFETLFIGWELLGLSSFLLITFYRSRYLPVKNGIKVFSIYRIGDVGILLAMWMSHHLWHENITFSQLQNFGMTHQQLETQSSIGLFISLMILVAAMAKSAQIPFSTWLPRAMEGPTPSSAVFYGSLSVHIGAFLLLRTQPFWEHQLSVRWIIALIGIFTAVLNSMSARVQPTIKGQIAYSSSAQIGLIFVEIAAGLELLALIHFVGNAFLRTYQLLVSPSVVAYKIREQHYAELPDAEVKHPFGIGRKVRNTLYLLSLKEWLLEEFIFHLVFMPIKKVRSIVPHLSLKWTVVTFVPLYLLGLFIAYQYGSISNPIKHGMAISSGIIALFLVAKSYNERQRALHAWSLLIFAHFYVDLAVTLNDHLDVKEATIYLNGILLSGLIGYFILYYLRSAEGKSVDLNQFHGRVVTHKKIAFVFLLACLGIMGFPITTAFFGEDLILTHIHKDQYLLAFIVSLTFIFNGIAAIRIYARVFLGTQARNYQQMTDLTN